MDHTQELTDGFSYSFKVEINIPAGSKGEALKKLLTVLDSSEELEYQISSDTKRSPIKPTNALYDQIQDHIRSNKLIRLSINKGLGVKMDIPCRFINFDLENQLLTVYHVDEKQVYSVMLNEIDDFSE